MDVGFEPAYLALLSSGELRQRVVRAFDHLHECDLCARECGADRLGGEVGACCTGEQAIVSSFHPHFGEEEPLVGTGGSGTIFFSRCNLNCQYCQNHQISQTGEGQAVTPEEIAQMMLHLQRRGCHNVNFVSPSHAVAQVLAAVLLAAEAGFRLPLVFNTGGYDSMSALRLLHGVVDIYMPDMKYADEAAGRKYSRVNNYPAVNQAAVSEMQRQVGDLVVDGVGRALRGLLARHLVLPNGLAGTSEIARFLAQCVSTSTYINVMDQYRPCYLAMAHPELDRRITLEEFQEALADVRAAGLHRLDTRQARRMWLLC